MTGSESDPVMTSRNDDDDVDDAVCLKVDELRTSVVYVPFHSTIIICVAMSCHVIVRNRLSTQCQE